MTQLLFDVPTSCSPSTSDFNLNSTTPTPPLPSPSLSLHPQTVADLPLFHPVSDPHFKWKDLTGEDCVVLINRCYSKAVHWIPNLFMIPYRKQGKLFIKELTHLFRLYSEDSAMECITLKVALVFPILVLQKPHRRSKVKDHLNALEWWLKLWNDGLFEDLLKEGNTVQERSSRDRWFKKTDLVSLFFRFMFEGKVKDALRVLNESGSKAKIP